MALKTIFEWVIDKAYHLFATGTSIAMDFEMTNLLQFSLALQLMYGQPSNSETDCHQLHPHELMDFTLPVEVMLGQIEEPIQLCLYMGLASFDEYHSHTNFGPLPFKCCHNNRPS